MNEKKTALVRGLEGDIYIHFFNIREANIIQVEQLGQHVLN
jgi:hypothetical protein